LPRGCGVEETRNARVAVITSRRNAISAAIKRRVVSLDKLTGKKVPGRGQRSPAKRRDKLRLIFM
jgi:hypothetical protein